MKKSKILLPILGLGAISSSLAPVVAMASCSSKKATVKDVIDTWADFDGVVHLSGFKKSATKEKIKQAFGDTLTIPKDIGYIDEYAFFNKKTLKSSIPSFIKHFRFEDEYKCTKIDSYAFLNAPFETVEFGCNRLDGVPPEGSEDKEYSQPHNHDNRWGLKTLGFMSFFGTKNLKYVKMAGSIEWIEKASPFGEERAFVFGVSKTGDWPTKEEDITCNIKTIDLSDYYRYGEDEDHFPDAVLIQVFGNMDIESEVEEQDKCKILTRFYNGTDGNERVTKGSPEILQFVNDYRNAFGADSATQYNEAALFLSTLAHPEANKWQLCGGGMEANHYDTYTFGSNEITGLSTTLIANAYIPHVVVEVPELKDDFIPYYQFDMSKWEDSFGSTWKINIGNQSTLAKFNETYVSVILDGKELTKGIDYQLDDAQTIKVMKPLTKKSKLEVKFYVDGNQKIERPRIVLSKA